MEKRCVICGKPYEGSKQSRYCADCKAEIKRAYNRAVYPKYQRYYQERYKAKMGEAHVDTVRKVGDTDTCTVCGKPYTVQSGVQKYCPSCRPIENARLTRERNAMYYANRDQPSAEPPAARERKQYRPINIKLCAVCGKPFADPPSSKRVCCSKACSSIRKTQTHVGKSNKWSDEAKARKAGQWQIDNLSYGTKAALKLPEGQRGPQNRAAKKWTLKSPDGTIYDVVNLLDWCRNHAELFGKESNDHNAAVIASAFRGIKRSMEGKRKPPVTSYMGWTLLDWEEPATKADVNKLRAPQESAPKSEERKPRKEKQESRPGNHEDGRKMPTYLPHNYILTAPDGTVYEIHNMYDWVRNHASLFGVEGDERQIGLVYFGLIKLLKTPGGARKRPSCKYYGWTLKAADETPS